VLPYAVALVGLELARRQAVLAGQRQLAGQVLEDLVRGALTTAEAERRLATFGIKAADQHAILVGTISSYPPTTPKAAPSRPPASSYPLASPDAASFYSPASPKAASYPPASPEAAHQAASELRRHLASSPPLPGAVTAVLEDCLVAVLGPGQPLREAAHLMHAHLSQHGSGARVGIGGWYTGMTGLRWSYYEAHEAMTRGPGINERERMSLSGLLLASEDVPLRDLAEDLLRPLREFDAAHAGSLIPTLRAYLDANGSVAEVAEQLIVHRNTVRYRLEQIERLTGQSLSSTATRVQLWLALSAVQLGHPSPGRP
jgi:purine catabolism regulator